MFAWVTLNFQVDQIGLETSYMILFIEGPVDWEGDQLTGGHGRHGWGTLDIVGEVA